MFGKWSRGTGVGAADARLRSLGQFQITSDTWTWILVAIGVVLRLLEYSDRRLLYRDEKSLLDNLVGLAPFDLTSTLTESQLAPPGFLIVERLMVRLPFPLVPAARLVPLVCAIASMFLMRWSLAASSPHALSRLPWDSSRSTTGSSITRPRSSNTPPR